MSKISLGLMFFFGVILIASAQRNNLDSNLIQGTAPVKTDTGYVSRALRVEEVNFTTSYYNQDGENSAVTGGIGTEKLIDFATTVDVRLVKYDLMKRKHSINIEMGVDAYTSASSDNIKIESRTGASISDRRFYPSIQWNISNPRTKLTMGLNGSFSKEWDYTSRGLGGEISKLSRDNNREFGMRFNAYLDRSQVILPGELQAPNQGGGPGGGRPPRGPQYPDSARNTYNLMMFFTKVISQRSQLSIIAEPSMQQGLLATKFQRVFFDNNTMKPENLPSQRMKLPIAVRFNTFIGGKTIVRAFYRFYIDNWGMTAHTLSLEMPYKVSPFFTVSPFYRFHYQNQINYFSPYKKQEATATYFTSDYDLATTNSHAFGMGLKMMPMNGIFKMKAFTSIDVRYEHYIRSTPLVDGISSPALTADILTLHAKFTPEIDDHKSARKQQIRQEVKRRVRQEMEKEFQNQQKIVAPAVPVHKEEKQY
jgi:hypothetical protein